MEWSGSGAAINISLPPVPKAARLRLSLALNGAGAGEKGALRLRRILVPKAAWPVARRSQTHQPPEPRHCDFAAKPRSQPLDYAPQDRLVAADDRLAERRLQLLDGFDLGGVGAAQEIAVGRIARIVERGLDPALRRGA